MCRAVAADDDEIDHAMLHQMAASVVGDHRMRHALVEQFEGGPKTCPDFWGGFVDVNMQREAAPRSLVDRRERGTLSTAQSQPALQ